MNINRLKRVLRQTFLLPIVALALVAGALAWQLLDATRAVSRIQLADNNIETCSWLTALMVDEETGLRSYQTTGNEIFLQTYEYAAEPFRANLRKLRQNLEDQGADTTPLNQLRTEHIRWVVTVAEPIIATIEAGGDTRDPGLNLRAKGQMDAMRKLLLSIKADQITRRNHAVESWETELRHTLEAIIGSVLIMGFLIGMFARNQLSLVSDAFQRALAALREHAQATYDSEQRLRAILVSLSEGVVVCNLEGGIELMNPAAEALSGWTQADALGRRFEEVFPLETESVNTRHESAIAIIRRERRTVAPAEAFVLRRPDSTERTVDQSGAPIRERNGDLGGIVLVLRDSTQQRRTQSALLASEKLAVAGRLAATIAHEIHNPLDSVANLLYLMRTSPQTEENAQFLDMAQGELSRATQISRALLGMYRESRTAVALDVSSLLRSVLILLERRFKQDAVQMKTDLCDPAVVTGFPAELRQVFTNLLVNAAEASSPGSVVKVTTRLTVGESANGTHAQTPGVLITVEDHGSGIPADVQRQLFQPFFSTKGEAGTGLGLWVSKGIVDKHGGTIDLRSDTSPEHHGTTLSVFLPRGQAEWNDAHAPSTRATPSELSSAHA